jgi:oligopeptide transport system ATP-binding protein
VQAQTLALLRELQQEFGTAIILITHDLGVVAGLCDEVMVLYGGRVMEQGSAEAIFYRPSHPYTIGLLGAVPRLDDADGALLAIPGAPPNNMLSIPQGCPFSDRCAFAQDRCKVDRPLLTPSSVRPELVEGPFDIAADGLRQAQPERAWDVLRACHRSADDIAVRMAGVR